MEEVFDNISTAKIDAKLQKDKDVVNIDFDGYVDGKQFDGGKAENHELEIGSKSFK